jgi:hypothetical protein
LVVGLLFTAWLSWGIEIGYQNGVQILYEDNGGVKRTFPQDSPMNYRIIVRNTSEQTRSGSLQAVFYTNGGTCANISYKRNERLPHSFSNNFTFHVPPGGQQTFSDYLYIPGEYCPALAFHGKVHMIIKGGAISQNLTLPTPRFRIH